MGRRTALFISDLHLGVGRDPADASANPRWHPIEDFRWHREFADFLERMNREEKGHVDLVLLGDVLELWQSLSNTDCRHEKIDKNLGCTEDEARARALRVLDQHQEVLDKLRWFATQGDNRVTIVPGNHDAALAFPRVAKLLLDRIHAPAGRLRLATEGYWWSADGKVIAEHGHQIDKDPNRFDGWPDHPFLERGGVTYLQQPWGAQLVQDVFNCREPTYPVLDNLSEEVQGLRYALRTQKLGEKVSSFGDLARFILFQTSWAQSLQGLGSTDASGAKVDSKRLFDLDQLRDLYKQTPERFVIDSLPAGEPLRGALADELRAGRPVPGLNDLTEEEIRSLCAQREIYNENAPEGKRLPECPKTTGLGAAAQGLNDLLPGAKDKRFRDFLTCLRDGLPVRQRPTRFFTSYVYGHTHQEELGHGPFSGSDDWKPQVWNDGAWQRRVTPQQFCSIARRKGLADDQALLKIVPEDLPPCYSFVRARWEEGKAEPVLALVYWVQESGRSGDIRPNCPFAIDPACQPKKQGTAPSVP